MTKNTLTDDALKQLTKRLVVNCVRTPLEPFHAGRSPISLTGDDSDVLVTDAKGQTFALNEISRLSDPEMKALMQSVVDRVYTFLSNLEDPEFLEMMSQYDASIARWDTPKTDQRMLARKYFRKLKELDAEAEG
ncbi:hypothetical protein ACOTTU_17105 [Roseobacter sp. EG26]|uniref:hypothetical protein n=1 Tax=Roseobacter sp. EG26 TaxID=3412477 RepID=UPI003CE4E16D